MFCVVPDISAFRSSWKWVRRNLQVGVKSLYNLITFTCPALVLLVQAVHHGNVKTRASNI